MLKDLCKALGIEDNLSNRIKAYRYNNQIHAQPQKRGQIFDSERETRAKVYEKIKENVEAADKLPDEISIEEAAINGASDVYCDGEWIDRNTYGIIIEEKMEKELLRKIVLIHEQFPELLQEFLKQFEFDKI